MVSRCAPVPAKMAKMARTRQLSCATCVAWRKVSSRLQTHAVVILSLNSVMYDIGVCYFYFWVIELRYCQYLKSNPFSFYSQWAPAPAAAPAPTNGPHFSTRQSQRCNPAHPATTLRVTVTSLWGVVWWTPTGLWRDLRKPSSMQSFTKTLPSG